MHSVHLPFQCSKVYRLHDQKIQDNSFNFRFQIGKYKGYNQNDIIGSMKIPVLKRLFIQNFCKRSRCLEENPVFLFL
jgi:hypothetical protein